MTSKNRPEDRGHDSLGAPMLPRPDVVSMSTDLQALDGERRERFNARVRRTTTAPERAPQLMPVPQQERVLQPAVRWEQVIGVGLVVTGVHGRLHLRVA